jgi:hypothetical protein
MTTQESYTCGVCHKTKAGRPHGGVNTPNGEVITCSSVCWWKAHEHACTAHQMVENLARKGKSS